MSGSVGKRRSLWDSKEENQLSARSNEQSAWQERENYPRHRNHDQERENYRRHHSHDLKALDLDTENALKSKEFDEWPSRDPSPGNGSQKDAKRDMHDISQSRRPGGGDVKSYPLSSHKHGSRYQNQSHSPEASWDLPHRKSRSRSRGRVRGRSRSLSRGRNGSRSLSRGRERDRGYSRSPPNDYRREPYGAADRRSGFGAPSQVCRLFTAGNCRRGSQCRFYHPENVNQRDGGRSERDRPERWGAREERGRNRYDGDREEPIRNHIQSPNVCNDFLNGRCRRGSSCRYSHPDAASDSSHKRPRMSETPCKFFMMGNCSRDNCRFSHDVAKHDDRDMVTQNDRRDRVYDDCEMETQNDRRERLYDDREMETQNDRRDRGYEEKKRSWNGPTWNEAGKQADNGPTWRDASGVTEIRTTSGWGDSGNENVNATDQMIDERHIEDNLTHKVDEENKIWTAPDRHVGMDNIAESGLSKEIMKEEPQLSLDGMQRQIPYGFSINAEASGLQQPSSTVIHSALPENSQVYSKMEANILMDCGLDSPNGGDMHVTSKQTTAPPGQNFNHNSDTFDPQPPHFGGSVQGQPVISANPFDGHNIALNGPMQENFPSFKVQNTMETQHGESAKAIVNHNVPQMTDNKPIQMSNLPASFTEKFVNEQLPQLYAALNPPKPVESMPPVPDTANLYPRSASFNAQPDQPSMYRKRHSDGTDPRIADNGNQYQGFSLHLERSSPSANQNNGGPMNNTRMNTQLQQRALSNSVLEEQTKSIAEKFDQEPESNGVGNVEADAKVGDGDNGKDEKAMRIFKNSLVEFVKEILKPKWKEGQMSREVHKAIVKKVVDKVTSATQGVNIPATQAKLDQYLQSSKPKLTKLVEAYTERFHKTS